jgi:hypothetical protein
MKNSFLQWGFIVTVLVGKGSMQTPLGHSFFLIQTFKVLQQKITSFYL